MRFNRKVAIPIIWLRRHITKRQFILLSSVLVGFTAGIAAVILKSAVHFIYEFVTGGQFFEYKAQFLLLLPMLGLLLTVFYVQVFRNGKLGRGTSNVLYIISQKGSRVEKDKMYTHVITAALTGGFGGSAGLESPIVVTGSAIGSNYSRFYHLSFQDRTLLLACGAAAGISAAFSAPIAGILFAIEVLLTEVTVSAFTPLLLAAAAGALCNRILLQEGALFFFNLKEPFHYQNVPFYIGLGLLCGLVSVYYSRMAWKTEALFDRHKDKVYAKAIIGGLVLGLLIFLFPPLFGEGYQSIKTLSTGETSRLLAGSIFADWRFNEWAVLAFIGATGLMKVFAAMTTISSGGNGGNFAPSMFVGAYTGFFFAKLINLLGISKLPEGNFTMVGMAGIVSGVMHAPLTGIFLIAEITGGYQLMIPLMMVTAIAFALVKYIEPYSLDTKHLAARGHLHRVDKDKAVLKNLRIINLIETDYQTIKPETTLGELTQLIAAQHQPIYPVLNEKAQLLGLVQINNIREMLFKPELYTKMQAAEMMVLPLAVVHKAEDMSAVMQKFDETNALVLPVTHNTRFVGFISKSDVFTRYRKLLIRYSQE